MSVAIGEHHAPPIGAKKLGQRPVIATVYYTERADGRAVYAVLVHEDQEIDHDQQAPQLPTEAVAWAQLGGEVVPVLLTAEEAMTNDVARAIKRVAAKHSADPSVFKRR